MTKNVMFELFKQDVDKCQSSMDLLNSLALNQFSFTQLLELINTTSNIQNKALLTTYFINTLKNEEEIYNRLVHLLSWTHTHHPINNSHHLENCLTFAIYCYLNGASKKAEYIAYINLLTNTLLNKNHPFNLTTFHGLLLCREGLDELIHENLFNLLFCQKRQENRSPFVQILQLIGQRGSIANYQQVIALGEKALETLEPELNQYLIQTINTAITEARLELELSLDTGFWTQLIGHFKRCYTYGWSGFFNPNTPTYVRIAENNVQPNPQHNIAFPNPLIDFYSVAHFDSLVKTSWWYLETKKGDNYSELNNNQQLNNDLKLMEMLMVNDFYKEAQAILQTNCKSEIDLTVHVEQEKQTEDIDVDLFEQSISQEEFQHNSPTIIEEDDDSPFHGFIVPLRSNVVIEPAIEDMPEEKAYIEVAKELLYSASTYAEQVAEEMHVMEDITTAKEYVNSATGYTSQVLTDVSSWAKNMFFSISNPILCSSNGDKTSKMKEKWL